MAKKLPVFWAPQEGPQTLAAIAPIDELFFGGTRGGGKSDCGIGRQVRGCVRYGHAWNGLMIRRKYKDLAEIRRRFDELIRMGMPAERVGGPQQTNYVRFLKGPAQGAVITLAAIKMLEQADDWIGHQFTEITIDEAPTFPFLALLIDKLRGSLRSPHGVPTHIFMTGNPGGPGAAVVKLMFIDKDPTGTGKVWYIEDEDPKTGETFKISQAFIKSRLEDNKILCENDPKYVASLRAIRDPNLRAAWLEGRWDVYIGQAFTFSPDRHILKPEQQIWPIPDHVPIYMTFDWGYGAPFSVGWWWVDNDDRVYRFGEWYGWNGVTPNVGQRVADPRIAEGILFREKQMGILGRKITRLCDPTCQNKKPNYMGGGQGPSTIDEFIATAKDPEIIAKYGEQDLRMVPGDANRQLKIRQFRNRLDIPDNPSEMPMLMIYSQCEHFERTIPALCVDEENPEDLEDKQEDHCFDDRTEILTKNGWKLFKDLSAWDRVATMTPSRNLEWQKPYEYICRDVDEELYSYTGRVNFLVTSGHRFPAITRSFRNRGLKKWKMKRADELKSDWFLPRTAKIDDTHLQWTLRLKPTDGRHKNEVDEINGEAFCEYLGFWLAEGCMSRSGSHYMVHVDQAKSDVSHLLNRLGYNFSKTANDAGCIRYTIQSKQLYYFMQHMCGQKKSWEKRIPRFVFDLPKKYKMALYRGLMLGDGSFNHGMPTYATASKGLADDFQELLFHIGKVGNCKRYDQKHTEILGHPIKEKHPYYRIHVLQHNDAFMVKQNLVQEHYAGKVYCVRVPNGTIYVRRNGTPYWSGNCYDEACHICMARPIGADLEALKIQLEKEKKEKEVRALDNTSLAAQQELFHIRRNIAKTQSEYEGRDPGDIDPMLDPKVYGLRDEGDEDIDDIFGIPI